MLDILLFLLPGRILFSLSCGIGGVGLDAIPRKQLPDRPLDRLLDLVLLFRRTEDGRKPVGDGLFLKLGKGLQYRWALLPLHGFCGELGKSGGERIRIPSLEEHQPFGRRYAAVLLYGVVHTVLSSDTLKGFDVAVRHFDIADALVLPHKFLYGLLAVGQLCGCIPALLPFRQQLCDCTFQHTGAELCGADGKGHGSVFDFFLQNIHLLNLIKFAPHLERIKNGYIALLRWIQLQSQLVTSRINILHPLGYFLC